MELRNLMGWNEHSPTALAVGASITLIGVIVYLGEPGQEVQTTERVEYSKSLKTENKVYRIEWTCDSSALDCRLPAFVSEVCITDWINTVNTCDELYSIHDKTHYFYDKDGPKPLDQSLQMQVNAFYNAGLGLDTFIERERILNGEEK